MASLPHKTATIFISAHSMEDPSVPIRPPMEVRMVNSQMVCGRSNFENAESIQDKLRYWTSLFSDWRTRRGKKPSTYSVLELGKQAYDGIYEAPTPSVATSLKRIRYKDKLDKDLGERFVNEYKQKGNLDKYKTDPELAERRQHYRQILTVLRTMVNSGEDLSLFYQSADISYVDNFITLVLLEESDPWIVMYQISAMTSDNVFNDPIFLLHSINKWIWAQLDDREDKLTNRTSIDPVIHEKEYVFRGNYYEDTNEIQDSFYGIHLIQDSEHESSIQDYGDGPITYDNAIAGHQYILRQDDQSQPHRILTFKPRRVDKQTPFMKTALAFFDPKLRRVPMYDRPDIPPPSEQTSYYGEIKLSEIIAFFHSKGYTTLNIIDTGCRNVDDEKYSIDRVPELKLKEMMRGIVERTNKGRRKLDPSLGKKMRLKKSSAKKRYSTRNAFRKRSTRRL